MCVRSFAGCGKYVAGAVLEGNIRRSLSSDVQGKQRVQHGRLLQLFVAVIDGRRARISEDGTAD